MNVTIRDLLFRANGPMFILSIRRNQMLSRPATATEVKAYFKEMGHSVRIQENGSVEIKMDGRGAWTHIMNLSDYRFHNGVYQPQLSECE